VGWTTDLLTGLAEHLAARGAGTWRPDGSAYASTETAIVIGAMPPDPDRVICLRSYTVDWDGFGDEDDDGRIDVTTGLQVRTRGGRDPREALDLADAVRDALDGLAAVRLGAVWVSQIVRRSGEELTAMTSVDRQADRAERVDNYYVQASRPTPNRT
jgi:hypothetical protein